MIFNECRLCGEPANYENFDILYGYWNAGLFICHEACKLQAIKDEAYECQVIDADCNDCKHFKRGKMIQKGIGSIWEGVCLKFNKPTRAFPNFCSGHKCFEHRRS